jgi:hypothetical protein
MMKAFYLMSPSESKARVPSDAHSNLDNNPPETELIRSATGTLGYAPSSDEIRALLAAHNKYKLLPTDQQLVPSMQALGRRSTGRWTRLRRNIAPERTSSFGRCRRLGAALGALRGAPGPTGPRSSLGCGNTMVGAISIMA